MVKLRKIGLDLDNTIIDYGPSYRAIASEMGFPQQLVNRESIREALRKSDEDDEEWQRFQSILYTDGLEYARPAPGLISFLRLCEFMGVITTIISHKTQSTPARFGSRDLRAPACEWLYIHGIVPTYVAPQRVFFCADQTAKVRMVALTQCDLFVDDLTEVLIHPDMAEAITRVRYVTGARSEKGKLDGIVDADFLALTEWLRSC